MNQVGDTNPDESERSEQGEREQGRRLLIANLTMLLMGMVSIVLAIGAWTLGTYLLIGPGAISWSGRPPLLDQNPELGRRVIAIGAVLIAGSIWLTYQFWKKLFYSSGYISQRTQGEFNKGRWPVIGGYWKPLGYVVYIGVLSYGAYLGYVQEGLWALLLTLAFVFWLVYLAWIDLRTFIRQRRSRKS